MAIPSAAKPTPLPPANANVPAVDSRSGFYAMEELQRQNKVRNYIVGMGRIIPCSCTGTNVLILTPNGSGGQDGEGPLIEGYKFGDAFLFWAAATSTEALIVATVVPKIGTLGSIKVYKTNGSALAGIGDVVQNSVYVAYYAPHLDSNSGGLVLK